MIITFVGHGTLHIDANLSDKIVAAIKENIKENEITTSKKYLHSQVSCSIYNSQDLETNIHRI